MYINRVVQKGDIENKNKFKNFVERNNEFYNKKKLRLNERIQKIRTETDNQLYSIPNKKHFDKNEIRNPEEFFSDQKNFVLQKNKNLENQREEIVKQTNITNNNYIPEINKNSKNIAENLMNFDKSEVFQRLHNQKNNKNKNQIFSDIAKGNINEEKDLNNPHCFVNKKTINENTEMEKVAKIQEKDLLSIKKGKTPGKNYFNLKKENSKNKLQLIGLKINKKHLQEISSKLHDEAKKKLLRNEERVHKMYDNEVPDLICKQTKIMNIQKFLNEFKLEIKKFFDKKNSLKISDEENVQKNLNSIEDFNTFIINLEDYCNLLENLGFIKNNYDTLNPYINSHESQDEKKNFVFLQSKKPEEKKAELIRKIFRKEAKLIKDSWNILLSSKLEFSPQLNKNPTQIKPNEEENIDVNSVLTFLCVIQGYLKGDLKLQADTEHNQIKQLNGINKFKGLNNKIKINPLGSIGRFNSTKRINFKNNLFVSKENLKSFENPKLINTNPDLELKRDKSDFSRMRNKLILSDDENNYKTQNNIKNLNNIDENIPLTTTGEVNKFKRIKSKDSNQNQFLIRSIEGIFFIF